MAMYGVLAGIDLPSGGPHGPAPSRDAALLCRELQSYWTQQGVFRCITTVEGFSQECADNIRAAIKEADVQHTSHCGIPSREGPDNCFLLVYLNLSWLPGDPCGVESVIWLMQSIDASVLGRRLLILDSPAGQEVPWTQSDIARLRAASTGWIVLAAGSPGETALLTPERTMGPFVARLLEAMHHASRSGENGAELPSLLSALCRPAQTRDGETNPVLIAGPVASSGPCGYILVPARLGFHALPEKMQEPISRAIPYFQAIRWLLGAVIGLAGGYTVISVRTLAGVGESIGPSLIGFATAYGVWLAAVSAMLSAAAARRRRPLLTGTVLFALIVLADAVVCARQSVPAFTFALADLCVLSMPILVTLNVVASILKMAVHHRNGHSAMIRFFEFSNTVGVTWDTSCRFGTILAKPETYFFAAGGVAVILGIELWTMPAGSGSHAPDYLFFRDGWLVLLTLMSAIYYLYGFFGYRNLVLPRR